MTEKTERLRERLLKILVGLGICEQADALIAAGVQLLPEPESEREKFADKLQAASDAQSSLREGYLAEADLLIAERDRAVAEALARERGPETYRTYGDWRDAFEKRAFNAGVDAMRDALGDRARSYWGDYECIAAKVRKP